MTEEQFWYSTYHEFEGDIRLLERFSKHGAVSEVHSIWALYLTMLWWLLYPIISFHINVKCRSRNDITISQPVDEQELGLVERGDIPSEISVGGRRSIAHVPETNSAV